MAFKICVLADSISPDGARLTTFGLEFPREILAETCTHTILSKNASSSRAIPVANIIKSVIDDPYIPEFGRNQRGMQAGSEVDDAKSAMDTWLSARDVAVGHAVAMASLGAHKQVANRIIENYGWVRQVITGTEWANFFGQRTHASAHPAFQKLSRLMYVAMRKSAPKKLTYEEWHFPFITPEDRVKVAEISSDGWFPESVKHFADDFTGRFGSDAAENLWLAMISAARCARVSYNNFGGRKSSVVDELTTFAKLVVRDEGNADEPIHASPLQHQAMPMHRRIISHRYPELSSNLKGWFMFRKMIPNECIRDFSPPDEEIALWKVDESCIVDSPESF